MRLLIVEDDEKTARALASGLERGGFATATAHTGEEGFFLLNSETFDLVVLDWMLPGRSGIEILKTLRSRGNKTPVLLLTARDSVDDRVLGLESGADDYLVKPFAFAELAARIRTLLRRSAPAEPLRKSIADLVVDLEARRAWRTNKPIELTPREFDLLVFLLRQPGQVVTREMLAREVWREANRITPLDNVIDVHLAHLRGKVDEGHAVKLIEDEAIFITPSETGNPYPPFSDQKGWILLNEHLMGQTILDTDGRRTEVVNDVHLLFSKGRMILVHVDISFNGFLRKWGLDRFATGKDQLISWRYVQPLSVEDHTTDIVTLSVAREQALELPSEDLADALEVLSGDEQRAMFSALDPDKAAAVLGDAEPRAWRQLIAFLSEEKARQVLGIMSVLQIADFFSSLPHAKAGDLMKLLPQERASRVQAIMSNSDAPAAILMSERFFAFKPEAKAAEVLHSLRNFAGTNRNISYLYIVAGEGGALLGVVDLRDLVVAPENASMGELMISPVVTADQDCLREDLVALFAKYQFHILPVVGARDRLLGIVRNRDIMKGTRFEPKAD